MWQDEKRKAVDYLHQHLQELDESAAEKKEQFEKGQQLIEQRLIEKKTEAQFKVDELKDQLSKLKQHKYSLINNQGSSIVY
jgi:F0F1-type ATP synthase membrane subunit b/b'